MFSFFEDETIKMIYNFSEFKLITSLLEDFEDTKGIIRINNLQSFTYKARDPVSRTKTMCRSRVYITHNNMLV